MFSCTSHNEAYLFTTISSNNNFDWTAGSGYDLKIRYSNVSDSTPHAEEIALQELNYLEPNRKVTPGGSGSGSDSGSDSGSGSGIVQWGSDRFHSGKHIKGKGRGKGTSRGKTKKRPMKLMLHTKEDQR
jgi:hypothetical protein